MDAESQHGPLLNMNGVSYRPTVSFKLVKGS